MEREEKKSNKFKENERKNNKNGKKLVKKAPPSVWKKRKSLRLDRGRLCFHAKKRLLLLTVSIFSYNCVQHKTQQMRKTLVLLILAGAVLLVAADESHPNRRNGGRRRNGNRSTTTTTESSSTSFFSSSSSDGDDEQDVEAAAQHQQDQPPNGVETCEVARLKCAFRVGCGMALQVWHQHDNMSFFSSLQLPSLSPFLVKQTSTKNSKKTSFGMRGEKSFPHSHDVTDGLKQSSDSGCRAPQSNSANWMRVKTLGRVLSILFPSVCTVDSNCTVAFGTLFEHRHSSCGCCLLGQLLPVWNAIDLRHFHRTEIIIKERDGGQ